MERLWRAVLTSTPRVVAKSWASQAELTAEEAGEIELLSLMSGSGSREASGAAPPLLVKPPDRGVERLVAGRGLAETFLQSVQAPLQHAFAFAIPNGAALTALAAHAPLVELGAGTGYWASQLRARGAACDCFDLHPPDEHGSNAFHASKCWTRVDQGEGAEVATRFATHSLLLVWPYSLAMDGEDGRVPWDAEALAAYTQAGGHTVAHVGELKAGGPVHGASIGATTTSLEFARALVAGWALEATIGLPNWPHMRDELTIWKRRGTPSVAATEAVID